MRTFQILISVAMIVLMTSAVDDDYGDLETMDVEKIMNDPASWKTVYDCLMDKAPCGDLQKLRAAFPQIVETRCDQCTPKQKEKLEQVVKIAAIKYPKEFQEISERYKPKTE